VATRRNRGFTLLEILVAVAILAIMSVMAYRGVSEARVSVENAGGRYASRSATASARRCAATRTR